MDMEARRQNVSQRRLTFNLVHLFSEYFSGQIYGSYLHAFRVLTSTNSVYPLFLFAMQLLCWEFSEFLYFVSSLPKYWLICFTHYAIMVIFRKEMMHTADTHYELMFFFFYFHSFWHAVRVLNVPSFTYSKDLSIWNASSGYVLVEATRNKLDIYWAAISIFLSLQKLMI